MTHAWQEIEARLRRTATGHRRGWCTASAELLVEAADLLACLGGNDALVSIAVKRAESAEADLAEAKRPLDAQMARLNKKVVELNVRCNALAARNERLRADLKLAAETLRRYEVHHREKGTTDSLTKAQVNTALASRFEATLREPPQPIEGEKL